ncbi:hypothetical protein VPH35_022832 [Triticum aestivum]
MCTLVAAAPKRDVPLPPPPPPPPPTTAPSLLYLTMSSPPSSGPSVPSRPCSPPPPHTRRRSPYLLTGGACFFRPTPPLGQVKDVFFVKRRCGSGKEQQNELCSRMILKLLDLKREDVAM